MVVGVMLTSRGLLQISQDLSRQWLVEAHRHSRSEAKITLLLGFNGQAEEVVPMVELEM